MASEANARIQWVCMAGVLVAGAAVGVGASEWAVLLLCCGLVTGAEALNTAIEKLADRVTEEREETIRIVKDAAAGGVLLVSLGAAAAGLCILGPRLWLLVSSRG